MTMEQPEAPTSEAPPTESSTAGDPNLIVDGASNDTTDAASPPDPHNDQNPKDDKPKHDCIICNPKEDCKHTVPLHETVKPMTRGKTGYEDLWKKVNEMIEWWNESGITLNPKKHSS